jgi:dTMP kinase
MFITFEGGEGTGKSTQIKILAEKMRQLEHNVVTTREPGGTTQAEALRNLLVSGDIKSWSAEAEALLNYAARDSHLHHVIRPALQAGATVLCDRFMDSTRAYQGHAGGCSLAFIDALEHTIVATTRPTTTFIFDLDAKIGLSRAMARGQGAEDRFERKGLEFHQALRAGFLAIAKSEPTRCKIIDASHSIEHVSNQIWAHINGG